MLKIGEIRELIRLLDETSLTELRFETDDAKLLLKKPDLQSGAVAQAASLPVVPSAPVQHVAVPAQAPEAKPSVEPAASAVSTEDEVGIHYITAPMVGTFYEAPAPDADPYVAKGNRVDSKTVVCIVEAMKLMNEIEAEVSGEIIEILVKNGQLVEYGQPMFKIKLS